MGVFYESVKLTNPGGGNWKSLDLYFARSSEYPTKLDPKSEALRKGFEGAFSKAQMIARNEDEFMKVANEILSAAESSLVAAGGTVADGQSQLDAIKGQIERMAVPARSAYLFIILAIGGGVAVFGFFLFLTLCVGLPLALKHDQNILKTYMSNMNWLGPACWMLPGTAFGVILIGFFRNRMISYDDLGHLDQYGFSPLQRFIWVALLGYGVLTVLYFKLVNIGVGTISLNEVSTTHPEYGLLIGIVCGVSEAGMAEIIINAFKPAVKKKPKKGQGG